MQKNYLLSNAELTTNTLKSISEKRIQKNIATTFLLALFTLFGLSDAFGQSPFVDNNTAAPNTFTVPAGITSITINLWGGGGAGGGSTTNNSGGSGGGSGGYTTRTYAGLVGGEIINYTLGTGGTGSNGNGTAGTASTLTFGGFTLTANGGNGGGANQGAIGTGGTATGGTTNTSGNSGLIGTTSGGNGGNAPAGGGTGGNGSADDPGNPGNAPGGGGGGGERANTGGSRDRAGGNGGSGGIQITFTCPTFTAGTDQTLATCATTSTLAAAALPSGVTGTWTIIAGAATVTTPTSPTSGVTAIVPGTPVTLRWTVTNGACGSSFDDVIITSPAGPGCLSYCTPTGNLNCTLNDFVANVTFNTLNNNTTCNAGGYTNFPAVGAQTTSVLKGSTYNFSLTVGAGIGTHGAGVWVDWNQDGDFVDAGEFFLVSNAIAPSSTTIIPITVPIGAATGNLRMRVRYAYNIAVTNAMSCTMAGTYGETEDYTITTIDPAPCVAPTAQPTALNLSPSGTNISGSFTAASPVADSYLVLISTNPAPPSAPINGTTYTIGSVYQIGYNVVDNDSNTAFNATGLSTLTTYYFYIYSSNGLCTGGPLYLGTSPLTGNATTLTASYCTPSSTITTRYIRDVFTTGNITNLSNLGTAYSATGYADYTALPPVTQIPGGGVAVDYYLQLSRQNVKIWVDWNNNGVFTDAAPELVYQTGGTVTIAGAGGFVVPPATLPGNYRIRIRTRNEGEDPNYSPCGLLNSGETEDYTLTVVADCLAKPNALYDGSRCDVGTVVLGVEGTPGVTEFRFYDSLFGGTLIGTAPAVPGITNWTTPALATTTSYYVTAFNGVCESWYRQEIAAKINPIANIVVTPSVPEVCGEGNVVQITAGGDFIVDHLVDEDFESGGFGVLTRVNVAANADTQWTNRSGPYVPTGSVWKPAITSKAIGNMFVVANSDFATPSPKDTQIRTAVLDASAYSDLFLNFRHYFSYYPGEPLQFADVDVSTNGGGAWTNVARYTSNQGFAGEFANTTIDLSAYAGLPSVMVRFRFHLQGSAFCDGWAIDDVKIYGTRPLNTTFTWSGGTVEAFIDPACTIPYVAQTVNTVYVRPTALQLASTSWSFTANATLGNGCPISEFIVINNKTKLWKGNVDNNWYNANNWEPIGVPDANTCVIIYPGSPATNTSNINTTANDGFAKTVTVRPSGVLTIHPENDLTVTDNVTVDAGGTFNIENSGSLIQVNNLANTGTVSMKRNVNIRRLDYVYWSSPVANFASSAVSPLTPASFIYKWAPTLGGTVNNYGNWITANEAMVAGKGYIVRGPNSYTTALQNFTANFVGVPNNGIINMPISRGVYNGINYSTGVSPTPGTKDDDNWNLIGNPYPSAINANLFLATNTNIAGFIKYWTHGTLPTDAISTPFYNNYAQNYTVGDYATYNATGSNPAIGSGNIAAGQGFFVLMNHSTTATTENVVFNNSMRRNDYRNDLFFRDSNVTNTENEEKHRIWLNLISPASTSSTTLVGYVTGASNNLDRMYDAPALDVKTNFELYSFLNTNKLNIQGKALPFNNEDQIPLGIKIAQNGTHTIGISTVDGLFENASQGIYLEDRTLGITHDLRIAPYSFTATTGIFENRFVLKFNNATLGNEDFVGNSVTVYTNENINVNVTNETIKSVRVFDLLGRVLGTFNNVNSDTFATKNISKTQSAILVEVILENGASKTYKVIF